MTHKLENNIIAKVLPEEWEFWAPRQAPQAGSLASGEEPQTIWLWKPAGRDHRTGGNRNTTLGGCTQGLVCTRNQGDKAVASQEPGPDLPAGSVVSPGEVGGSCGPLQGQRHWWWRYWEILIGMSCPAGHHFDAKTWPHPTACGFQCWDASGLTTGQEHSPTNQQRAA